MSRGSAASPRRTWLSWRELRGAMGIHGHPWAMRCDLHLSIRPIFIYNILQSSHAFACANQGLHCLPAGRLDNLRILHPQLRQGPQQRRRGTLAGGPEEDMAQRGLFLWGTERCREKKRKNLWESHKQYELEILVGCLSRSFSGLSLKWKLLTDVKSI